jgi:chemotaxis protein MotA
MSRRRGPRLDLSTFASLGLIAGVVIAAQMYEGSSVSALVQPTAALVVIGGTIAAVLLSFPWPVLSRTWRAIKSVTRVTAEPEQGIVTKFEQMAVRVLRKGVLAIEPDIATSQDPFLKRALGMVADGSESQGLREALTTFSNAQEDGDEECALVLETAAGYAPTLGILGAVLGLIRVMENLGSPSTVGAGIAVAFVATVYGVGIANLLLLPLATRLRAVSRTAALNRELIIEGAVILQGRVHPRLVDAYLSGFIRARTSERVRGAA